jgi:hypothetical protein
MPINNPFDDPAFSMAELTAAINILPNNYGLINQMGLFRGQPVRTRQISIEENNGVLNLLPTKAPGSPGTVGKKGKRKLRGFSVPHIPHDDVVLPEEVQGIRAFGSEDQVQTLSDIITDHLQTMRNKHAITLEHLRMGALKGIILDSDGSVLLDLYQEFGITPKVVSFALGVATTDVKKKCLEVKRHIEKNLMGEVMEGVQTLVSPEFFDALTSHDRVKDAYQRWHEGSALRDDMRDGFPFGGLLFKEYIAEASDGDGNIRRFIAANEGHAFPVGTQETFRTYFAPADFNETVNTLGRPIYVKQESRKFERGTDIHTQSNPLPMCHRPAVLVKLTA